MPRKTRNPGHGTQDTKQGSVVQFPGNGKKANPERLQSEIIDYIRKKLETKEGRSLIVESLGEERLQELAQQCTFEDLKKITDDIHSAYFHLKEAGCIAQAQELTEKPVLEKLYSSPPYKADQLEQGLRELTGRGEEFQSVVESFFRVVMENLDGRIFWKPMVAELMQKDGYSTIMYFMDKEHLDYLQRWDDLVALLVEAIDKWGLREYAKLMSGGKAVEIQEGDSFCTTADGVIFSPAYVNIYESRKMNLRSIRRGIEHECGHHHWRSFRINLHPKALDLGIVRARFTGERRDSSGRKCFIIECAEKTIEVRRYPDILKVVKYPKLLAFLHNVADDKRIDTLNMLEMPGIAEAYRKETEFLVSKRPELKGTDLGTLLEALLQQTVADKTNGEVPEALQGKLEKIKQSLATMEIREETDGTDSLNVALRWYVDLEPELDALADRIVEIDGDSIDKQLEKMIPDNFFASETDISENDVSLKNEDPGPIMISRRKGRRSSGPRRLGIDPLQFLDLKGSESEDGNGESGEPGEPYDSNGNRGKQGKDAGTTRGPGYKTQDPGHKTQDPEQQTGNGTDGMEFHGPLNEKPFNRKQKTFNYPEWTGTGYREFKGQGTKIVVEYSSAGRVVRAPKYLREKVKRIFRKYAPKEGELVRGLDSGEPDPELQERYLEEIEAGRFPEPNYFADVVYQRTNVVMSVNIDMSTSMEGRKFEVAAEGAAVIACAASILKYPTEVAGFNGENLVNYYLMPVNGERITVPVNRAHEATPMAGAVRHATKRTIELKRKSKKRYAYQFWLCDGEPNCSGDEIDPVVDTAKAIAETRALGIRTFGIIIANADEKSRMEENYRKIFGGGWYVVVESAEKILNPLLRFMRRVALVNR